MVMPDSTAISEGMPKTTDTWQLPQNTVVYRCCIRLQRSESI